MRHRLLLMGVVMLLLVLAASWVAPTSASQTAARPAAASGTCGAGKLKAATDRRVPEFCPLAFCSSTPGMVCQLVSGTSCDAGHCQYHRVSGGCDPSVPAPSCGHGCS